MKRNAIVVGYHQNGFSANSTNSYLLQVRLPNIIQDEPVIHVYFHQFGTPLEMVNNDIHFAYLGPISASIYDYVNNDIQCIHTPNIISQESDVLCL